MTIISSPSLLAPTPSFDLKWYSDEDKTQFKPALSLNPSKELSEKIISQATAVFSAIEKKLRSDVIIDTKKVIQDVQAAIKMGIDPTQVEAYRPFVTAELEKHLCFTFLDKEGCSDTNFLITLQNSCAIFRRDRLGAFLSAFNKESCKKAFDQLSLVEKQVYEIALAYLSSACAKNTPLTTVLLSNSSNCNMLTYKSKELGNGNARMMLIQQNGLLQFYAIKIAKSIKVV